MSAAAVILVTIFCACVLGLACGGAYLWVALRVFDDGHRHPGNTVLAGVFVAALAAVQVLAVAPVIFDIPGGSGTVQYWAGTVGMVMFTVRTLSFLFMFFVALPVVFGWVVYAVVLAVRGERRFAVMLCVPVVMFVLTWVFMVSVNPGFAPMV